MSRLDESFGSRESRSRNELDPPRVDSDDSDHEVVKPMDGDEVVVIVLAFLVQAIFWGLFMSFAEYFEDLVDGFNSSYTYMTSVGVDAAGFANMACYLSAYLVIRWSYGGVVAFSGICIGLAFLLSSYDTSSWQIYFTYTILFGIGGGIVSQASIGFLFDNAGSHANIGVAVVTASIGVGYIIFSCLAAYCLSSGLTTWRGLFRIYSCIGFLIVFLAFGFYYYGHNSEKRFNSIVLNSPEDILEEERLLMEGEETSERSEEGSSRSLSSLPSSELTSSKKQRKKKSGFELLFSKEGRGVQCLFVSHLLSNACSNLFLKYSVLFTKKFASDSTLVMYLVPIVIGSSIISSRVLMAWIFSSEYGRNIDPFRAIKIVHLGGFIGAGVFLLINHFGTSVGVVLLVYFLIMATTGLIFPLIPLRTVALEGKRNHLLNVSVQYFANGIGIILFGVFGGVSYDYGGFEGLWTLLLVCFFFAFMWDEVCFYEHSICKNGLVDYLFHMKV